MTLSRMRKVAVIMAMNSQCLTVVAAGVSTSLPRGSNTFEERSDFSGSP